MKTVTYQSPIPKFNKATGKWEKETLTAYNCELGEAFGSDCIYIGTTTPKGKKPVYVYPKFALTVN